MAITLSYRTLNGSILAVHLCLLLHTITVYSPTVDETSHLPAGLSYWRLARFDLYRVNPPLVASVAAIPLLLSEHRENWSWYSVKKQSRQEFTVGKQFVDLNGPNSIRLYRYGRLACIPFSLIGAEAVYWFARDIYGPMSGTVAMSLWCFSPNILGNSAIITPDVPAAGLAIFAAYVFWKWLGSPGLALALVAGLALGLAELAKTTCLILYLLWPAVWLVWHWRYRLAKDRSFRRELAQLLMICGVAIYVTNLGYLFDGSFLLLRDYQFASQTLGGPTASLLEPGNRFQNSILGALPIPFPADYVYGIDLQRLDFEGRRWSYAAGIQQFGGWWWWYLYAMAVKTQMGTMLLILMAGVVPVTVTSSLRSPRVRGDWLVLVPALCVLILVSSQTGFSRYFRYVLPAFPFVYVWIAQVAQPCLLQRKAWVVCIVASLACNILSCAMVHPHHLAFFNEISGGSINGHRHLLDANVDWGQCSLELKRWLDARAHTRQDDHPDDLYLSLFAVEYCMNPRNLGIYGKPIPASIDPNSELKRPYPLEELPPGLYAISVNHLHAYRHLDEGEPDCSEFLKLQPIATIGYAIQIFQLPVSDSKAESK